MDQDKNMLTRRTIGVLAVVALTYGFALGMQHSQSFAALLAASTLAGATFSFVVLAWSETVVPILYGICVILAWATALIGEWFGAMLIMLALTMLIRMFVVAGGDIRQRSVSFGAAFIITLVECAVLVVIFTRHDVPTALAIAAVLFLAWILIAVSMRFRRTVEVVSEDGSLAPVLAPEGDGLPANFAAVPSSESEEDAVARAKRVIESIVATFEILTEDARTVHLTDRGIERLPVASEADIAGNDFIVMRIVEATRMSDETASHVWVGISARIRSGAFTLPGFVVTPSPSGREAIITRRGPTSGPHRLP